MLKKINNWLISFLELQLIISLISLPILIHWGIAISYMVPLANLIFTPLLALFLWCSCIFALCSIIHIPCTWFVTILDYLAYIWHYLLSFAQPEWLIGFSYQMIWLAIIIALCLLFFYTFFYPSKYISLCILTTCFLFLFTTRWISQTNGVYKINNLKMYAMRINNKVYLIDYGSLCSKQNFYSWIDYTILPELIKTAGITQIDILILYKPNKKLPQIAQQFAQQTSVKTILVTTKFNCYDEVKKILEQSSVKVLPIYYKRSATNSTTIQPIFA